MNNLCQLALQKGGSLNYLMLPATITEGLGLTNPSIFIHKGHYFLNLRHVKYALYHSEGEQKFQSSWGPLAYLNPEDDLTLKTINYLCELDPNTLVINKYQKIDTSKLDVKPIWQFIGLEDARVVYWDNSLFITGVRRDTTTNGEGRMELSTIDNKNKETKRIRIEPPTKGSYCEKNWMPILDLPYHYVKWTNPTEVVKVDPIKGISETVFLVEQKIKFPRDIRGGSQVITIGNYYVAVTHEVDLWYNEQKNKDSHYYHRFIIWDKKWNIVAHSSELKFMTGAIEFTCGLAFDGNDIILPFGFQDSTAFILKFPINLLETLCNLKLVKPKIKKSLIFATPKKLENFIYQPYNEDVTFELGEYYFLNGHYASAMSFYLRTAEYSKNSNKTYEALLMTAKCLSNIKRREVTELGLWLNALNFDTERPEAYLFISAYYEKQKKYNQMYSYAILGLKYYANAKPVTSNLGYEGSYQLNFQKAVSAWWIGKSKESKDEFIKLLNKSTELSETYQKMVRSNITFLDSGPYPFLRYYKGFYDQLRYKFPGSESIEKNFSQTYQDMFALSMVNGKRNGTYFEIGAADPFHGNNTALLEQFGWTGTSLEILPHEVEKFKLHRKNEIILCDATKFDYSVLKGHIDYLQVDCEPPETTYKILTMLPWDQCTFGVITYEHDYYTDVTQSFRKKSREFLLSKGYMLIASNISPNDDCPYEDWWVHPKHIDKDIIKKMLADDDSVKNAEKYMFGKYSTKVLVPLNFDWGNTDPEYVEMFSNENFIERAYEKHCKVKLGDVVVDAGANCGSFTYSILDKKPKQIYCVEPSNTIIHSLKKNVGHGPVTFINKAISDFESNNVIIADKGVYIYENNGNEYMTTTFKKIIEENNITKIDFLKFDCEGGEYFIFNKENYDFIINNVRHCAGEWHINNHKDAVEKFIEFRDLYLRKCNLFNVYERDGKEVTQQIFDDNYLYKFKEYWKYTNLGQFMIYFTFNK